MIGVSPETYRALAGISGGEAEAIAEAVHIREPGAAASDLDERTFALVRIAVLVAMDAPPASYAWQIAEATEAGATGDEILGVLKAVAPQVGAPKVVAAAPEIMLGLGLSLPAGEPEAGLP